MNTKRWVILAACALLAGFLAFGVTRHLCAPSTMTNDDELTWMRSEFKLTPAQADAIEKLQDDYHPVCMEHCRNIGRARQALTSSPQSATAQSELTRLEAVCHDATTTHVKQVAALMSPDQGARFLALVLPKISGQRHDQPLGLK